MRISDRSTTRRKALKMRSRRAAADTLLDRTVFTVSPSAYRQFLAKLDAPPRPNKRLLKTMRTPAPWD